MMSRSIHQSCLIACCLWAIVLSGVSSAATTTALPESISRVLEWQSLPGHAVSIWVQPLDSDQPVLSLNPDTSRNPASLTKLLVSFAALERLGPTYTWRTEVYADSRPRDGVLAGDLRIRGGGDPYLVTEEFWKLIGRVRRAGIQRIDGNLIFDNSYFALSPENPAAFDNAPFRAYNQAPHPLLVNFNVVRFHLDPDSSSGSVRVTTEPDLPGMRLENRLRLGPGPCGGYQRGVSYTASNVGQVILEGQYPASCNSFSMARVAMPPEEYAYTLFKQMWQQSGGEFAGGWRRQLDPAPGGSPLVVHESRPLGELIRFANKHSSNVMTRHFKLALAAELHGVPATEANGNRAVLDLLAERGVDTRGVIIDNAAGLSRTNRISARQMNQLLLVARQSPYMPEFVSSLALAGMDGTMARRFRNRPEAGRMHLKTGALNDVSAVAGYVKSASGRDYAVVVMVNAEKAHQGPGQAVQDAVLKWVFEQ